MSKTKNAMKFFLLIIIQILLLSVSSAQPGGVNYTCTMHPEIHSGKPGKCPKCGMALVRKTISPAKDSSAHMNHEMHDHTISMEDASVGRIINLSKGKTVVYHLYARDTIVNYTGKKKRAIAINGSIPAPTLTFTEGDTAEIHLHNQLKEETSLHWHGVILPNRFDGVPF